MNQAGGLEMGTYFSIPNNTDVENISLSAIGRVAARTIKNRGAYIVDRSDFAVIYMEPTCTSASETALKTDWRNTIMGLMRRVTSNSEATPNGGTGNRRGTVAPALDLS